MTSEVIAAIAGALVSLALEVIPGLKDVWEKTPWKPLILGGFFLVVAAGAWALTCYTNLEIWQNAFCCFEGLLLALWRGVVAWLASQGIFATAVRHLPGPRERAMRELRELEGV
jgi:hypothetical protein